MMRSDEQLEHLLRQAHGAEAFEGDALAPLARVGGWRSAVLAIAACLGLAAAWWAMPAAGPTRPPARVMGTGAVAARPGATRSVVLAISEDAAGEVACVRWADHCPVPGTRLADMGEADLARLGAELGCEPGEGRVLIVGMEGPAGAVPASDAEVARIAGCFRDAAACGEGAGAGFDSSGCAATVCAAPTVAVRVASLVR